MEKKLLNKGAIQTEQREHNGSPAASHDPTLYRVLQQKIPSSAGS
ncbi:hypothetical protein [Gallaecimonas pentaromativorans]